jgi:hypothetical protein
VSLACHAARATLFQFDDVASVEIRLQGDCAAFSEWIQAAPECQLLTCEGLIAEPGSQPSP